MKLEIGHYVTREELLNVDGLREKIAETITLSDDLSIYSDLTNSLECSSNTHFMIDDDGFLIGADCGNLRELSMRIGVENVRHLDVEEFMTNPTTYQLEDPQWWKANAPEGANLYVYGSIEPWERFDGEEWSYFDRGCDEWFVIEFHGGIEDRRVKSSFPIFERPKDIPEGATHYKPENTLARYYKVIDGAWHYFSGHRETWIESNGFVNTLVPLGKAWQGMQDGFPPPDTECEYRTRVRDPHYLNMADDWENCIVKYASENGAFILDEARDEVFMDSTDYVIEFRAIRSEKQAFVEDASVIIHRVDDGALNYQEMAEELYKEGFRKGDSE